MRRFLVAISMRSAARRLVDAEANQERVRVPVQAAAEGGAQVRAGLTVKMARAKLSRGLS
jgi:hypothetical protein